MSDFNVYVNSGPRVWVRQPWLACRLWRLFPSHS